MARVSLLQSRYGPAIQDLARHLLPQTAVWSYRDCIPNIGAPLRRAGGWQDCSPNLSANAVPFWLIWAPFAAASQLIVFDLDSHTMNRVDPDAVTTSAITGAAINSVSPVFFDELVISPDSAGSVVPKKYAGSGAVANLGGSPPTGTYATTHKSRLVLARSTALPNTVWFSGVQDPETWDVNSFITTTHPITGLASIGTAIFVFSAGNTEIIRGATPPTTAGGTGDMTLDALFEEGCIDHRSIAVHEGRVIWASERGVFLSDGAGDRVEDHPGRRVERHEDLRHRG